MADQLPGQRARMRSVPTILLCTILVVSASRGQTDSLWQVWNDPQQADSTRLTAIQSLAWKVVFEDPDSGMALAREQLAFADRLADMRARYDARNTLAVASSLKGDQRTSLDHFRICLILARGMGDRKRQASVLSNLSNVYRKLGDLPRALEHLQAGRLIDEELNDRAGLAGTLNNIGTLHTDLGELPKALENYQQSAAIHAEIGNSAGQAQTLLNIGATRLDMGDAAAALPDLERCLALYRSLDRKREMGMAYNNLGRTFTALGRTTDAALALDSALHLLRLVGSHGPIARNHLYRGELFLSMRDPVRAASACREGLAIARANGLLPQRKECSECLRKALEAKGDRAGAYEALKEFVLVSDSLLRLNNAKEVLRLDMERQFQQQQIADSLAHVRARFEDQLAYQEALGQERERRNALLGGAMALIVIGGILYFADRRRRQERFDREAAQLETQALRSQMNPHFIFNALNSINAFVQQNDQDSASTFLTKFARVMRSVLENSRHSEVSLAEDLDALRGYMELERMRMQGKFDFTIQVAPDIDPEEVLVPPLVVQPFVENAIWHGMARKEERGRIDLRVERQGAQLLWIVEDDGVGRQAPKAIPHAHDGTSDTPVKKTSLGTAITRARLDLVQRQHGGKAGFRYVDLPQGTRVEVEMPMLKA